MTNSGWQVSAVLVAAFLPIVVAGPILAPVVDRVETRRLLIIISLAQAVAASFLAINANPFIGLVLISVIGVGTAVAMPALMTLVPVMSGEDGASKGYAHLEAARALGMIGGPAAAGLLAAQNLDYVAFLGDAASFVIVSLAVAVLKVSRTPDRPRLPRSWWTQVRGGIEVITADATLRLSIVGLTAAVMLSSMTNTVLIFFAAKQLAQQHNGYGLLLTAQAIGTVVIAGSIAPRIIGRRHIRALIWATVLLGATRIGMALLPTFSVALTACAVAGACVTLQNLALRDLIRSRVPDALRGRAFASSGATLTAANIGGTAAGGPLSALASPIVGLLVSGVGTVVAAAALVPAIREHSKLNANDPQPSTGVSRT